MDAETAVPAPEDRKPIRLPIGATATGAWRAVLDSRGILAVVVALGFLPAWLPFLEESVLGRLPDQPAFLERLISLMFEALGYAALAYVASYWHRLLLLGRAEVVATLPRWTRAETRLFWWYVGFAILAWIGSFVLILPLLPVAVFFEGPGTLPPWVPGLMSGVVVLLYAYLAARISLAFPAAAILGPSRSFPASWGATVGNGWRLVAASAVALSPLVPPAWVAYRLYSPDGLRQTSGAALMTLTYLIGSVITAGVLSLAYRQLVLAGDLAAEETAEPPEQPDLAAEAGVRVLAPRVTLFEQDLPDEAETGSKGVRL